MNQPSDSLQEKRSRLRVSGTLAYKIVCDTLSMNWISPNNISQNASPFDGSKSTYLHSVVIPPRLLCTFIWREKFYGDTTHVILSWGESAGAISVGLHMITNGGNTEGLFRGAFMQSGSPIPVGDISHGQPYYDFIVSQTGCSGASDTLQCLRQLSYRTLKAAVDATPGIFAPQASDPKIFSGGYRQAELLSSLSLLHGFLERTAFSFKAHLRVWLVKEVLQIFPLSPEYVNTRLRTASPLTELRIATTKEHYLHSHR